MSKTHSTQLQKLAEQIGNFIEYWGFKKIHGMIWTHLYLSPTPLSAQDLIQRLRVSKALISLSMKDLLEHQLILQTDDSLSKKNKFYVANPEVFEVIRGVLETRELQMMTRIASEFKTLADLQKSNPVNLIASDRLALLGDMTAGAQVGLKNLLALSKIDPSFLAK
jgi:DNA-binding transcriptional regulator GbsR (MarR family)